MNTLVTEMRVALSSKDYDRLANFYFVGRELKPAQLWNNGQRKAMIINLGHATPELFDETQAETIDNIESGQRVSGQVRFALQVPYLKAAMERLVVHGATLVHEPVVTPWGDPSVRLQDPDGMQVTLFQKADSGT